ncbi:hypothetical protein ABPG74_000900 [Tetrahymena malaccensis]
MNSFILLVFANLVLVINGQFLFTANNMRTLYQGPSVPIKTKIKLISYDLPALRYQYISDKDEQSRDIYFMFQFKGIHSRNFRPVHPSNSTLGIYVNSIKANIYQEFDNQVDLYYFILEVKNYTSKYSKMCEILFEGAQANKNVINATTYFSQNVSAIQSSNQSQQINFTISFLKNAFMLNGVPTTYTMQSQDGNRQPPLSSNIYKQSQLIITLYYNFTNITDLTNYQLYFVIDYKLFDKIIYDQPYSQFILSGGKQVSDGTWNYLIKFDSQYTISNLQNSIGIYNQYNFILQMPGYIDYTGNISSFGANLYLCEIGSVNDCFYENGDIIYAPEPIYVPYQPQNNTLTISFPQNIEVLSEFEFIVMIQNCYFLKNTFLLAINLPQDLIDFNQDLQFNGYLILNNQNPNGNIIEIDINKYDISSDYTVQILIKVDKKVNFLLPTVATLHLKLKAPNRIFTSDYIKVFLQTITPILERYKILEIQSTQQLNFVQSKSLSLQIMPLQTGIRVKSQYNFTIYLGQVVYQDTYLTIKIPKEILVDNIPNIQLNNFDPGFTQFCSPYLSIQNQLITLSQMVCPKQKQAYTSNNPLSIQITFSEFQNPQIESTLDFYLNVFSIDQNKQFLYNDNSFYLIAQSKTSYSFYFTTNATATCLNDIQLRGFICEQLIVTLNSNSGIFSTEEIVITFPPEVIPPIDFIDNSGTPYQNKMNCRLIESYLPTSACIIDIPSHTITITDSQFSNTIYYITKSIIIENTVIPRYMKPLGTNKPPFPSDITPFTYIVRDSLTKVNSSTKQVIQVYNFYQLPPINSFLNLQFRQIASSLNQKSNTFIVSFLLQTQLFNGDMLQIFFPTFYNFAQSTVDVIGLNESFTYQFVPHQSIQDIVILQISVTKTISCFTNTLVQLFVKNIQNPAQIPNYASATVINDYNVLSDSTIQIIDKISQQPFQYQVVKNCFIITDSSQMTIQQADIISRGVVSQSAIYGEDMQFIVTMSFSNLKDQDLQSYLDLYLNIPAISQDSLNQLQVLINGQPTKDFQIFNTPNYINSFRFFNFPFILSDSTQYYTVQFQNLKSKKELFSNQASSVKVQRNLQVTGTYLAQLDSFTLNTQQSLVCDPSCLECVNVSTYCTACTPDKQLDTMIPGKCVGIIASKLMNINFQQRVEDSLLNYNNINMNQLTISSFVDIYIQMQIFFTGNQTYFFELQIPQIFRVSSNSQLYYGKDSSNQGSVSLLISEEQTYNFTVDQINNNYTSLKGAQPIPLIHTRYQMIKLTQVQLPSQNFENYLFTLSLILKDTSNPQLVRQQDNIQKNVNIECSNYCKTCQGSPNTCLSCYEGDIYDNLGFFCITQPCWNGQVKVKTSKGFVCTDNDHTQSCRIPYCLYCDTSPNNSKSKCSKCFYNFTLSVEQDKCNFKDPNTNDKEVISNLQIPFDGKTQNPTEQNNSTQIISREMDLRNLWKYEQAPLIPPDIKLQAPIGIIVCIFNIVYSLFNSLTQHKVSFTVEASNNFGFAELFIIPYYLLRLGGIPQFQYILYILIPMFALNRILQIFTGKAILNLFNQELQKIGYKKEWVIEVFFYRYFFKIMQEQTRIKDLKQKKIIQSRESPNQMQHSTDTIDQFEIDDVLDSNNPNSKLLEQINKFIYLSIMNNIVNVGCYVFSKLVYSDLYSVSSQISTLMFELFVFCFAMIIFDILLVLKCMTQIGMYQNLHEPFQYNFNSGKQIQNDNYFQLDISNDQDKQTDNNSQANECQKSHSVILLSNLFYFILIQNKQYKKESPEQSKYTQKKQIHKLKKRHSWPQQNIEQSETFQITIRSLFEKGQKRKISIPLKGKQSKHLQDSIQQFDEKSYDHQGISQFNLAYLKKN